MDQERHRKSLSRRLRSSATLLAVLFFACVGGVIDQAYQQSLLNAIEGRLQAHIYTLLTVAEVDGNNILLPQALAETRFNQYESGLYAFVLNGKSEPIWKSQSSNELKPLPIYAVERNDRQFLQLEKTDESGEMSFNEIGYNALGQGIVWQSLSGQEIPITIWVVESSDNYYAPLNKFRWILWCGLLLVAVLMHLGLWVLMYWALLPLGELARDVARVENGELEALPSSYPREVKKAARAINLMLAHEREQLDRYKLTLADLAHSLKTPLSVIKALLEQDKQALSQTLSEVDIQIARMNQSLGYHLKRPVHQSAYSKKGRILIAPLAQRIGNALSKVYANKNMQFEIDIDETIVFPGTEDDLMELLGNLTENAFKYGTSKILIKASDTRLSANKHLVTLAVADDGPGIPVNQRKEILQRGVRLDTQEEGQGLGLALVKEILDSYNAFLEVKASSLGGALFQLQVEYKLV